MFDKEDINKKIFHGKIMIYDKWISITCNNYVFELLKSLKHVSGINKMENELIILKLAQNFMNFKLVLIF